MIKILAINSGNTYDIEPTRQGENISICPACSKDRKRGNQTKKCFSWHNTNMVGHCMNCNEKFVLYTPSQKKNNKDYVIPKWENKTELTDLVVKWFTGRMISQKTLNLMKVYSDTQFMPQIAKETSVISFPYFRDEKLVNVKYRDAAKNFKLIPGAELTLFNIDSLKNNNEAVIVEGEIDALSYIECGVTNVVSVPNGAGGSTEYLDEIIERFDDKQKIYIATDNDIPGIKLRNELVRRLGAERCLIVNFKDKKDANEYLVAYGGIELQDTITNALEIPVSGIINLNQQYDDIYDLYINGTQKGLEIKHGIIDKQITWETGRLCIVTGIPGHGKSEFVDYFVTKLNINHSMKAAYFSPENYPVKYHYSKIASKISGKQFASTYMNSNEFGQVFEYINDNFFFIFPEDDMKFETILEKAKYLVKKRGIKILVIDPYNKIEHLKEKGETETEYISRFLDKLIMFARINNVLVVLVAHPRKMNKESGKHETPTLYDINGSANFYNKCDYGLTVYRMPNDGVNEVHLHVQKVKFKNLGEPGTVILKYNFKNGRYHDFDEGVNEWDNKSYLIQNEQLKYIHNSNDIDGDTDFFQNITFDREEVPF